jgi:hypothetical protein
LRIEGLRRVPSIFLNEQWQASEASLRLFRRRAKAIGLRLPCSKEIFPIGFRQDAVSSELRHKGQLAITCSGSSGMPACQTRS